jgi:hypothetical protein
MMLPGGGVSSVVSLVVLLVVVEVPVGFILATLVVRTVLVVFIMELAGADCVPFLTVWRDVCKRVRYLFVSKKSNREFQTQFHHQFLPSQNLNKVTVFAFPLLLGASLEVKLQRVAPQQMLINFLLVNRDAGKNTLC